MHARTRRAATRAGILLAAVGTCALVAAACFPSYEFPDGEGGEGGVTVRADGGDGDGGTLDGTVTPGADAGPDATTPTGRDGSTSPLDATTDGPPGMAADGSGFPDSAVDSGLRTDLVLLLHLDETSFAGSGAIKDDSSNDNNASLGGNTGGTTPTAQGKYNGAAEFSGTGWIEVPNSPSLTLTTQFTLSAWLNYSTALGANVSPGVIVKRTGFGAASYTLFVWNNNSAVQAYVDVEESTRLNSAASVLPGAWHHLAAVYDGSAGTVTVYVDGAMSGQTTTNVTRSLQPSTIPVRIGDLPDGGNTLTNGKIDEVAIWSRALSAAEIMELATATGPL